ncbi:MAG TPA: 1-(5-phosphoribosyl)-5-[(5-phosphoribosylamino)methylideneamino]imidazole-4-carboxamide isomerase [Polyangiaceae bacterium]|nr:1-(5-phosphoribosyl)-5-[(5-phosphoribosylamino)methylideneamino]imidazole-4-carboxamide isomerase [Polyangiaceae bacterium]
MDLIPAIDLLSGNAVRLRQGRYEDVTVYSTDPAALAKSWSGRTPRLHVVDLEGARAGAPVQRDLVRSLVSAFGPGVQVGGGVRTFESAVAYFELGVERVVLGTAAIRDPELVARTTRAYPGRVIIAVDARGGFVATDGWLEKSEKRAVDLVKEFAQLPIAAVLYTDIERDGTEVGPNIAETARLARETGVPVIASGGVGTLEHLRALAAVEAGVVGAIVGRALLEGRFSIEEGKLAASSGAS